MWGAQTLKEEFAVSILTTRPLQLVALNEFYGTSIEANELTIGKLPTPPMLNHLGGGAALRGALFQRAIRAIAADYDVLISGYNICDVGVPAIHLVADFSWDDVLRRRFHPSGDGLAGIFHRDGLLRGSYLRLARMLSAPSGRDVFAGEDLIVANSNWTAGILRERYGVADAPVVYPPVTEPSVRRVPGSRNLDFACLGRISEEKRITTMFDILARVRAQGYPVRLRIVGALNDSGYSRRIRAFAQRNRDWTIVEGPLWGEAKWKLLSECGYGIHGCSAEAFGIAVAEMVKAGCIAFAPDGGGQAEVLSNPALLYRDADDAVEKIVGMLADAERQEATAEHLSRQAGKFSAAVFVAGFRAMVDVFLTRRERQGAASRPEYHLGAKSVLSESP